MDYERKYKQALKRANKLYEQGTITESLENIFPELRESEDERIRKTIIRFFKDNYPNETEMYDGSVTVGKALAWLEKQGEKKPADKVEPKFKVGDFITNDYCLGKVIEITNDAYLLDTGQGIPFSCEHNAHLWTIKDAKDGDVLVVNNEVFIYAHRKQMYSIAVAHCFVGSAGGFYLDGEFGYEENGKTISPATKKQCDLLFQKMKETGYEWDSEKKEVKEIEKQGEKKLTENAELQNYIFNVNQLKKDLGL